MDDEELVDAVLNAFDDLPKQIEELKRMLKEGDVQGSTRLAHSIKGASANAGGERVRRVAREMEDAGHAGDLEAIRSAVPALEGLSRQLRAAILEALPSLGLETINQ